MSIRDSWRGLKAAGVTLILAVSIVACASAPYQQMSDARQAIASAAVVVDRDAVASPLLRRARERLARARRQLQDGDYASARRNARIARMRAIEARERVEQADEPGADPAAQ